MKERELHPFMVQEGVREYGQGGGKEKRNSCSSNLCQYIWEFHSNLHHGLTRGVPVDVHVCI